MPVVIVVVVVVVVVVIVVVVVVIVIEVVVVAVETQDNLLYCLHIIFSSRYNMPSLTSYSKWGPTSGYLPNFRK